MARRRAPAALQRAQDNGVLIRRLTIVSSRGPPVLMVWLRRVHQWKTSGRSLGKGAGVWGRGRSALPEGWWYLYSRMLEVHPHSWFPNLGECKRVRYVTGRRQVLQLGEEAGLDMDWIGPPRFDASDGVPLLELHDDPWTVWPEGAEDTDGPVVHPRHTGEYDGQWRSDAGTERADSEAGPPEQQPPGGASPPEQQPPGGASPA